MHLPFRCSMQMRGPTLWPPPKRRAGWTKKQQLVTRIYKMKPQQHFRLIVHNLYCPEFYTLRVSSALLFSFPIIALE